MIVLSNFNESILANIFSE